jgi:hypothetical protein
MPECTAMRHPDGKVMEAHVKKMIKYYRKQKAKLKRAGLGVGSPAGVCDFILKDSF